MEGTGGKIGLKEEKDPIFLGLKGEFSNLSLKHKNNPSNFSDDQFALLIPKIGNKQGDHIFEILNSLSFPRYFKLSLSNSREKNSMSAFLLAIMSHIFHFPSFPGFFYKSSNFPEFSLSFP